MRPRAPRGRRQRGCGALGLWVRAELPHSSLSRDVLWDAGKQKPMGTPLGERTTGPREQRPGSGLRRAVISVNDQGAEGTLQVGGSRWAQSGDGLLPRAGPTPLWPLEDHLPLLTPVQKPTTPGRAARCTAVGSTPAGGPVTCVAGRLASVGEGKLSLNTKGPCVSWRHLEEMCAGLSGGLGAPGSLQKPK